LISRSALLDLFDAKAFAALELFDGGMSRKTWLEAFETVQDAPAVDAEPVRHGRWMLVHEELSECSACGMIRNIRTQFAWTFCPNCGTKMRGDNDAAD
jgi:hypothetical protein